VDNAPSSLKAARYPQADNCVDNRLPRLLHKNHDTPEARKALSVRCIKGQTAARSIAGQRCERSCPEIGSR
jgi:hypothetical protein